MHYHTKKMLFDALSNMGSFVYNLLEAIAKPPLF